MWRYKGKPYGRSLIGLPRKILANINVPPAALAIESIDLEDTNRVKFGVNTFIWAAGIDRNLLNLLPSIKQHGFDGVELPLIRPDQMPVSDIRRSLEENQLSCTFCSVLPNELSVIGDDAAVRKKAHIHLADCVRVAAECGATMIAGPLYSPVGYLPGRRRTDDEWRWAVGCYQSLGDTLTSNRMTIAIEPLNRFETYFLNTTSDAVRLAADIDHPNIGILFDTFHANIEEKDVAAALRSAGRHVKHVHACENDRGIPGTGHTNWPGVFQTLKDLEYDGWVTIESFGFSLGDLSAAASIWRDLAPSAEAIAFEGVEFLKRGLIRSQGRAG